VLANVGPVLASLRQEGGLWPMLVGVAAVLVPRRTRAGRFDGLALLALGASVLPALILVRHFRSNDFSGRYLSLTAFWALAAAVHGVVGLACTLAGARRGAVLALGLVALVVAIPAGPADPLAGPRADAAHLASGGPAVLLADYFDVYVPASLGPRGVLVPVGAESNLNRFRWPSCDPGGGSLRPVRSTAPTAPSSSTGHCSGAPTGPRSPPPLDRGARTRWSAPPGPFSPDTRPSGAR
jgi:hypothetical protein